MVKTFSDMLRGQIRTRMEDLADTIACGDCQDWSSYKSMTGEIRGLAFAERMLLDLTEKALKGD